MNPIVSVVTGTYNRLLHLQAMVNSVRSSIGTGLPYEIVIVDGGSTDGSIEWCKDQKDIVLIEQHALLGAVKAFNAGAYKAIGKYVVLANDDVEFLEQSMLCAISFMEDNMDVGIGCFYQNRGGKDWHVDKMPAIVNGRQDSVWYGQVCIVPKWLGDKVGWWGNYLRTYGGDNELSCNVWELGYKVEPAPCTFIIDSTPMDELRRKNNQVKKIRGQHPDTYAWLSKWQKRNGLGPIVRHSPAIPTPLKRDYRILYAPIYEKGHPVQKLTKTGLRDALSKRGLVVEVDYISESIGHLIDVSCAHDPDLFVMQVHDASRITSDIMDRLKHNHPNAKFVCWNGDYHPDDLTSPEYISLVQRFDLVGLVTTVVDDLYKSNNVKSFYWQIGYEEPRLAREGPGVTKSHDVVFLANGYSKERLKLHKALRASKWNVGIYGSWPKGYKTDGQNLYDFHAGHLLYQNAVLAVSDSQWPDATGFVSNRLFQAMRSGVCLLQQWFDGLDTLLGMVDMKHLVVWKDIPDLMSKIDYFMNHKEVAKAIGMVGQQYVMTYHSFDARVDEMMEMLNHA